MVSAVLSQTNYRGRKDTVSLNSTTFDYALNTNWTQTTGIPFRIRFAVAETAGGAINNVNFSLQANVNGAGWVSVTNASQVSFALSPNFASGDNTTAALGLGGTFVTGQGFEDETVSNNISLGSSYTELEYSLNISNLADGGTVQFRILGNGAVLNTYAQTPTVTAYNIPEVTGTGAVSFSGTPTVASTGTYTAPLDQISLYGQIFQSDGTTALTDRVLVAANASLTSLYEYFSPEFTVVGTPSKAQFDGAQLKLEWDHTLKDTATYARVTTVYLDGLYEPVAAGTITGDGAVSVSGTPTISSTGTFGMFSPTSVSNLEFWVDSDDATTITESAGAVSDWNDKSGNTRHLTQGTGTAQPSYSASEQFGKYGIRFAGDDFMDAPAFSSSLAQPNTIIVVARLDSIAGATDQAIINAINATGRHGITFDSGNDSWKLYAGTTYDVGTASTETRLITGLFNGGSSQLWEEGVSAGISNAGTENYVGVRLGQSETGAIPLSGVIFEVLVYSRALTTQEREDLESYLTQKWLVVPSSGDILFVRGSLPLNTSENQIITRLEGQGRTVTVTTDSLLTTEIANGYNLVLMSKTVTSTTVGTKLYNTTAPVLFWEDNQQMLGMMATIDNDGTGGTTWHSVGDSVYVDAAATPSELRAGLSGETVIYTSSAEITWAPNSGASELAAGASPIARLGGGGTSENRYSIYVYDQGDTLADATAAAGKRGYFGLYDDTFTLLNANGLALFDAQVSWLLSGEVIATGTGAVSYSGYAVASEASYLAPVTGDAAVTYDGTPTLSGSGSFTPAEVTGTGAVSYAGYSVASSGTFEIAEVTGTGAVSYSGNLVASSGTFEIIEVTGDADVSYGGYSVASFGDFDIAEVTGTGAVDYSAYSVASSGTFDIAEITGDGDVSYSSNLVASSGTFDIAEITGTGAVTYSSNVVSSSGTFEIAEVTGDGAVDFDGTPAIASTGSVTIAEITADGAISYASYSLTSSGTFTQYVTGDGAVDYSSNLLAGTGSVTIADITGDAEISYASYEVSGSSFVIPEVTGAGAVTQTGYAVSSSGSFDIAEITANGAVDYSSNSVASSGSVTIADIFGTGAVDFSNFDITSSGIYIEEVTGTGEVTYGGYVVSASGTATITEITATADFVYSGTPTLNATGTFEITEVTGSGAVDYAGYSVSSAADYVAPVTGSGAVTYSSNSVDASGLFTVDETIGDGSVTYSSNVVAASGTVEIAEITGTGSVEFISAPNIQASGTHEIPELIGNGAVTYGGYSINSTASIIQPITGNASLSFSGIPLVEASGTHTTNEIVGNGAFAYSGYSVSSTGLLIPPIVGTGNIDYDSSIIEAIGTREVIRSLQGVSQTSGITSITI